MYLQVEQKRTDFKPETDVDTVATAVNLSFLIYCNQYFSLFLCKILFQACKSVIQYMRKSIKLIQECLHGKNAENVLVELGIRFHRVIYDHLCQYSYNSAGDQLLFF